MRGKKRISCSRTGKTAGQVSKKDRNDLTKRRGGKRGKEQVASASKSALGKYFWQIEKIGLVLSRKSAIQNQGLRLNRGARYQKRSKKDWNVFKERPANEGLAEKALCLVIHHRHRRMQMEIRRGVVFSGVKENEDKNSKRRWKERDSL